MQYLQQECSLDVEYLYEKLLIILPILVICVKWTPYLWSILSSNELITPEWADVFVKEKTINRWFNYELTWEKPFFDLETTQSEGWPSHSINTHHEDALHPSYHFIQ